MHERVELRLMSSDAELHIRWGTGEIPTEENLVEALSLEPDPVNHAWRQGLAADGSRYGIRISSDAGDVVGPTAHPVAEEMTDGTRRYSVLLHISPIHLRECVEDGFRSMRSYCREILEVLKCRWEVAEFSFALEFDNLVSYGTTSPGDESPNGPVGVELWIGSDSLLGPERITSPDGLDYSETPLEVIHERIARASSGEVIESLSVRASGLDHQRLLAIHEVPPEMLDSLDESLLMEICSKFPGSDMAIWQNGELRRFEVEVYPSLGLGE